MSDQPDRGGIQFKAIDRFGKPTEYERPLLDSFANAQGGEKGNPIEFLYNGQKIELRRARPATCWVAIPKDKPKANGSLDWFFAGDVKLHDQGGRALVGGGDSGAQPVVIRMRNVIWPPPATNKPSIVLYIHKPDQPDRAESYSWADPGAARIGINLRWMQASCGIDGAEAPTLPPPTASKDKENPQ